MKNSIKVLLTLLITLFSVNSFAIFTAPSAPPNGTYVLDLANKLSPSELSQLNNKIENLNRTTKNEFGVLLLSTMDGESIDDVANTTFNKWGVGKRGLDNGVLLVISFGERKTRIETGKGVEGDLTDLQSSDILQNTLKPQLKAGKVYDGINDTIDKCSSLIESRAKEKASSVNTSSSSNDYTTLYILGGIFGGGLLFMLIMNFFSKRREEQDRLDYEQRDAERRAQTYRDDLARVEKIKQQQLKTTPDLPHHHNIIKTAAIVGAGVVATSVIAEEEYARRRREEEQSNNRRIEEESRSSSGSSTSYSTPDYSSSDSGSSSDGGFSGGDSGGGGASGDF